MVLQHDWHWMEVEVEAEKRWAGRPKSQGQVMSLHQEWHHTQRYNYPRAQIIKVNTISEITQLFNMINMCSIPQT